MHRVWTWKQNSLNMPKKQPGIAVCAKLDPELIGYFHLSD